MTFTKTDFILTLSFVTAVILLSFIAPAVGMTGDNINATDIPEFNITDNRFDFVGEIPDFPSQPSQGVLNHSSDKFDNYRGQIQYELGPGDNGNRIFIVAIDNDTVHLTDVEDSTINDSVTFSANDETKTLTAYGYEIDVHSVDISANAGEFEWIATNRPQDSNLPLIGGIADFSDKLVSVVAWGVSAGAVFITQLFEGAFNAAGIIFDVLVFIFGILNFIFTNYLAIISGAPSGFAAVLVSIPGVGMSIQFTRAALIILGKLPLFG